MDKKVLILVGSRLQFSGVLFQLAKVLPQFEKVLLVDRPVEEPPSLTPIQSLTTIQFAGNEEFKASKRKFTRHHSKRKLLRKGR